MYPIIRLVNRNLTISINPAFLLWQIIFPVIYIFIAGFAYGSLIREVPFGTKDLAYPAFLASGMIGFNLHLRGEVTFGNNSRYFYQLANRISYASGNENGSASSDDNP